MSCHVIVTCLSCDLYQYFQVHKHFTVDDHSHYVFTPRDLTQWILGLMRYPLSDNTPTHDLVLEAWSYEARRLFRDQLIGEKSLDQFDAILNSILRSDWSTDASQLDEDGGLYYVTWGSTPTSELTNPSVRFKIGRPLGKLSALDMQQVVAKAMVAYGE